MPFLDENDRQIDLSKRLDVPKGFGVTTPGEEDLSHAPPDRPMWNWGPAFRRQNEVGAFAASESWGIDNAPEAGFNSWNEIKGTPREADWDKLAHALNRRKFEAVKRDIDRERDDEKRLQGQPWWMRLLTEGAASILSPTTLLPGGAFIKGAKGGFSLAKSAASVGAGAALGTAAQEGLLHSIEQTRTPQETATAIGASLFLGGLLGAGGSALLSKGEWSRAVDGLNRQVGGEPVAAHPPSEPGDIPVGSSATERVLQGQSAGAAAVERASLDDLGIAGKAAGSVAQVSQMNPLLRLANSPSAVTRLHANETVENPTYLKMNMDNQTLGPAAETLMKEWNSGLGFALQSTDRAFKDAKKAGFEGSYQDFRDEVGKAMRRADTHENSYVDRTAKEWRSKVFDPLLKAAIKNGLLKEDVTQDQAVSYFSRMWKANKIIRQESAFKDMVRRYVTNSAPAWRDQFDKTAERRLAPLQREIDDLEMQKVRREQEQIDRAQSGELTDTGDMSEEAIRNALRIVQSGAQKPKGVDTLTQFVHRQGGLVDYQGELNAIGITNKTRPGFVKSARKRVGRNDGGWSFDDMAQHAWEAGYFPEHTERPTINEFLDALSDDFNKRRFVVRAEDRDAFKLHDLINRLEDDLSRIGAIETKGPRFSTSEETKDMIHRVTKAMNAEADQRIAELKVKLKERQNEIRLKRDADFGDDDAIRSHADDVADQVYDRMTGRHQDGDVRPEFLKITARGPLHEKTFHIPDTYRDPVTGVGVEDFIEHDVAHVGRRYTRIMGADVELASKHGDVNMTEQLRAIRDDYRNMRQGITDEKQLAKLAKAEADDIRDLSAVRDLLRGVYEQHANSGNWATISRVANAFNYMRGLGEVVLSSLTDAVRPAMVHGLMQYMTDLPKFISNIQAIRLSKNEAQLAGNVFEGTLHHRLGTLSEITDPHSRQHPIEAFMAKGTDLASKWNGIRMWTDWMKSVASVMTQNRVLDNVSRYGQVKEKERNYLALLGIDENMAERIAGQFKEHGQTIDGVRVAGTENWTDEVARRYYRAAINKDVDSIIVQKGVGDLPLFANTPTGRMLLQFKSFALASHQRVLLRGLQEDQSRFLGGMIAMTAIGMAITQMKALSGNREDKLHEFAKNPGWHVAEGVDRSGVLSVPMELSNMFEKASASAGAKFNPLKSAFTAFDEGSAISQKNQNRSVIGSLVGPSAGLIDDTLSTVGLGVNLAKGEEPTKGQKGAAERLFPFNSYLGLRQLIRYGINPPQ